MPYNIQDLEEKPMLNKGKKNADVKRSHKIVELLATNYFDGISNAELAKALNSPRANISRDLQTLEDIGYARKLESGLWSLSTKPLGIIQAYQHNLEKINARITESNNNIFRKAKEYN